ncbi:MAG: hypothetical protein ACRD13_01605 [Terriglobales bacterium]
MGLAVMILVIAFAQSMTSIPMLFAKPAMAPSSTALTAHSNCTVVRWNVCWKNSIAPLMTLVS